MKKRCNDWKVWRDIDERDGTKVGVVVGVESVEGLRCVEEVIFG